VTGANQGIGFETARELAARGASVHMVCRSAERGEAARAAIVAATGNARVTLHVADLSSLAQTKRVAAVFTDARTPLHILVNNAGALINPRCVRVLPLAAAAAQRRSGAQRASAAGAALALCAHWFAGLWGLSGAPAG
jgi:NAD(P)-dependent dehydrogenase (short-subunit alcohol dehydrogenase family)